MRLKFGWNLLSLGLAAGLLASCAQDRNLQQLQGPEEVSPRSYSVSNYEQSSRSRTRSKPVAARTAKAQQEQRRLSAAKAKPSQPRVGSANPSLPLPPPLAPEAPVALDAPIAPAAPAVPVTPAAPVKPAQSTLQAPGVVRPALPLPPPAPAPVPAATKPAIVTPAPATPPAQVKPATPTPGVATKSVVPAVTPVKPSLELPLPPPLAPEPPSRKSAKSGSPPAQIPAAVKPPEKEEATAVEPLEMTVRKVELSAGEIAERGSLIPTVYYFPIIEEDKVECTPNAMVSMLGEDGKVVVTVCPLTRDACLMQGSCKIMKRGDTYSLNYVGEVKGKSRYTDIANEDCLYGLGVRNYCLDPYYTLAADMSKYKPGDVIYVPSVAGLDLPNGSKHDGFFIVRDKGRRIIGRGRFDFYTGFMPWASTRNPFSQVGLGDKKNKVPYYKVRGHRAEQVKTSRGFPGLPPGTR